MPRAKGHSVHVLRVVILIQLPYGRRNINENVSGVHKQFAEERDVSWCAKTAVKGATQRGERGYTAGQQPALSTEGSAYLPLFWPLYLPHEHVENLALSQISQARTATITRNSLLMEFQPSPTLK